MNKIECYIRTVNSNMAFQAVKKRLERIDGKICIRSRRQKSFDFCLVTVAVVLIIVIGVLMHSKG